MTKIYHVLGSDIPHHNDTVLKFFAERLKPCLPAAAAAKFLVVGKGFRDKYPLLDIELYSSKCAVAGAVIRIATQEPDVYFYLHGQFNFPLWLAVLVNKLPPERLTWHIWGADLYEDSRNLKFKLAYPLRRYIQKKIRQVAGTKGDLTTFARLNPQAESHVVYFPTKMDRTFQPPARKKQRQLTVLLGNSGDHSNRHQEALQKIKRNLGENIRIILPMGYPQHNEKYIRQVRTTAAQLFPAINGVDRVNVIEENLKFADYLQLLAQCDVGYFLFHRQQGIGTLCLLIQLNIPVVLHRHNPFIEDMILNDIPFLFEDEVSRENIFKTQQKLTALNKENIAFFDPYFLQTWPPVLTTILAKNIEGK